MCFYNAKKQILKEIVEGEEVGWRVYIYMEGVEGEGECGVRR